MRTRRSEKKARSYKMSKKEQHIMKQQLYEELFTVHLVFSYDNDESKEKHAQFFIVLENFPPSIKDFNIELMKQIKHFAKKINLSFDTEMVVIVGFLDVNEMDKIRNLVIKNKTIKPNLLYRFAIIDLHNIEFYSDHERNKQVETYCKGYGKLVEIYNAVYTLLF